MTAEIDCPAQAKKAAKPQPKRLPNSLGEENLLDRIFVNLYDKSSDRLDRHMTDLTRAIKAAADVYGLPVELVKKTLDSLQARYARSITQRAKAGPCSDQAGLPRRKLPPLPKGLNWPTEHFDHSPEHRKHGGICRHLERVWKPLIAEGLVDMPTLRQHYPSTAAAIDDYKYRGVRRDGVPQNLPPEIDIPLVQVGSGRLKVRRTLQKLAA